MSKKAVAKYVRVGRQLVNIKNVPAISAVVDDVVKEHIKYMDSLALCETVEDRNKVEVPDFLKHGIHYIDNDIFHSLNKYYSGTGTFKYIQLIEANNHIFSLRPIGCKEQDEKDREKFMLEELERKKKETEEQLKKEEK